VTAAAIREALLAALRRIAPEADPAGLAGDVPLREELELDSMDFLTFVVAIHERLGAVVPEADYPRLATLDGAVAYLQSRLAQSETAHR
jgi:acyl carrier protein